MDFNEASIAAYNWINPYGIISLDLQFWILVNRDKDIGENQINLINEIIDAFDLLMHMGIIIVMNWNRSLFFYRQNDNIRRTIVCSRIVDHSDVVRASSDGDAPIASSFPT